MAKNMFKPSNPEREIQVAKLIAYFATFADGEEVSWIRIEHDTGYSMAIPGRGRDLVRYALRKLKRPYEAVRGTGVRLSAPASAVTILNGKFIRIDGAVKVAARTQNHLAKRHLEQMSGEDQRKMIIAAGFFGAVRTISKEASSRLLK